MASGDFKVHFKPFMDLNPESIPKAGYFSDDPLLLEVKKWRKEFQKQFNECVGEPGKIRSLREVASSVYDSAQKFENLRSALVKRKVGEVVITKQLRKLREVLSVILKQPVALPVVTNTDSQPRLPRQASIADVSHFLKQGQGIPRELSAEQEKEWRKEHVAAKDAIFEEEVETLKYKSRAEEICAKFSGNLELLIQEFIKLEDPAAVIALGRVIKSHHVTWLMEKASINPAVGARIIYLLGALPFTTLYDVLASFTNSPEDQRRLTAIHRVLTQEIKGVKQHDGRPSIVYAGMSCPPQGEPCGLTDSARQWFRRSIDTRTRFFSVLCRKSSSELKTLKAELEKQSPHKVTPTFVQKVGTLKQELQVSFQVAHNLQFLCCGGDPEERSLCQMAQHLIDLKDTYENSLKSLEWGSPRIKQMRREQDITSLTDTLQSMEKRMAEVLKALDELEEGKVSSATNSPTRLKGELKAIQTQIRTLNSEIQQALRLAACQKSNGGTPGFWDSVEESFYLENDITDDRPANEGLGSWIKLEELEKVGLLVNVAGFDSKKPLDVLGPFRGDLKLAWTCIQHNLELLGLKTVADMKRECLFNVHLLTAYFSIPDVSKKLKAFPYTPPKL